MKFLRIFYFTKIENIFKIKACSSGDRASDSDSESQGFDSLHAYELPTSIIQVLYQSNFITIPEL